MKRRHFMKQSLLAGGTIFTGSALANESATGNKEDRQLAEKPFKLNYAFHDGMFKNHGGADFVDQIKYAYEMGFRGIEDN
ncbi:MAG: xylose isomerase, partial [Chitinophagaceae bacterium]|nr:xylose isomerase [Chitinophagaceae bacterium]